LTVLPAVGKLLKENIKMGKLSALVDLGRQNQGELMRKHRCILSSVLAAATLICLVAAVPAQATGTYTDVDESAWYAEAIEYCRENKLMLGIGDNKFEPEGVMSRAQLATVLYRLEGEPSVSATRSFQDVTVDNWYYAAVNWAAGQKLMEGYGNGYFGPEDPVTREQMVAVLWRYAGEPTPAGTAEAYPDESKISSWAAQAIDWSEENGITVSRENGLFAPGEDALRYEIASSLMNYSLAQSDKNTVSAVVTGVWKDVQTALGYLPIAGVMASNTYDGALFQVDESTGYMTYAGGYYAKGVDVSSHQGEIDWEKVAASGIQFAIIRVGYRGYVKATLNVDTCFEQNIKGALNAGLKVGV
jgi:hypothetical protein